MEETLIVKNQHNISATFFSSARYKTTSQQFVDVGINHRMLVWPFGRCFSISSPSFKGNMNIGVNTLFLHFNDTALKDVNIRLYFMDKASSLMIYPDENDMTGDPLDVPIHSDHKYVHRYKIKISRSQHIQGDPLMECSEYTQDKSYNDCIQNELFMSFENILGCHPPLLAREPNKMCNGRYNLSTENEEELKNIFTTFNSHNTVFKCKRPCTTNLYTSRLIGRVPSSKTGIAVIFDRTISVTRSTFSINSQTFPTRLGGSVSSGRTLLWILVTLLGASQVYVYDFYNPFLVVEVPGRQKK